MCLFAYSCAENSPTFDIPINQPETSDSKNSNKVIIILVHGWGGNKVTTWGNFGQYLLQEPKLKDYRVFYYQYPTGAFGHNPHISDVANNLAQSLKNCCSSSNEYIFIAHSMGGIVVKEYILNRLRNGQAPSLKVNKVFLIATPNTGADLAKWARYVPGIPKAQLKSIGGVNDSFLRQQLRDWHLHVEAKSPELHPVLKKRIKTVAIYATNDGVVSIASATDRFPHSIAAIDNDVGRIYDHTNIVKPVSPSDFVVQSIITEISAPLLSGLNIGPRDLSRSEEEDYQYAKALIRRGEYINASNILKPLVTKYPLAAFLRFQYGTALSYIPSRRTDAVHQLQEAVKLNPSQHRWYYNLALALYYLGFLDEAKEAALHALIDHEHTRVKFLLGRIAYEKQDYNEARYYYQLIEKANADDVEYAIYNLSLIEFKQGSKPLNSINQGIDSVDRALRYAEAQDSLSLVGLLETICTDALDSDSPLYPAWQSEEFQRVLARYRSYSQARDCLINN
ncbi:DUF7379 domain-containing protein [Candidatus Nitrospira salsa]